MQEIIQSVFGVLAAVTAVYSIVIFVRIILSWFSISNSGRLIFFLNRITDPYLDWWRAKLRIRIGFLDFSVIVAIVSLQFLQNIFRMLSIAGSITLGNTLSIVLLSLWSIVSFIAGFCLLVLVLRGIAYFTNRNIYSPFWGAIDNISRPILYRLGRFIYGDHAGKFLNILIFSYALLLGVIIGGRFLIGVLAGLLVSLPL